MKQSVSFKLLPLLPVATGATSLLLRMALYSTANSSGLLPRNHPLYLATLILAAVTALTVGFFVSRLGGSNSYAENFPASRFAGPVSLIVGLCLTLTALTIRGNILMPMDQFWLILTFAAAFCTIASGILLYKRKQPHFVLHFVISLFFALHMVCRYREWSGNPQVEDYIFSVFGCVLLALFSYHRAVFALGMGNRRTLLFCGLMALFFCLPMAFQSSDRAFFLAGFLWTLTNLCVIDPPQAPESKEGSHVSA